MVRGVRPRLFRFWALTGARSQVHLPLRPCLLLELALDGLHRSAFLACQVRRVSLLLPTSLRLPSHASLLIGRSCPQLPRPDQDRHWLDHGEHAARFHLSIKRVFGLTTRRGLLPTRWPTPLRAASSSTFSTKCGRTASQICSTWPVRAGAGASSSLSSGALWSYVNSCPSVVSSIADLLMSDSWQSHRFSSVWFNSSSASESTRILSFKFRWMSTECPCSRTPRTASPSPSARMVNPSYQRGSNRQSLKA